MFGGAGSHSRSYMHPVTFNQPSLMDDFQIQPDVVTVVPAAAHPQLRMNFNQCEFFLAYNQSYFEQFPLNRYLISGFQESSTGGLSSV